MDYSCKWTKCLAFFISSLKRSHDRGFTLFGKQEQLHWINSPVYYFIIRPVTLECAIISQISHFILASSKCIWIIPAMTHNILPFS